jgi:hypothetical protein
MYLHKEYYFMDTNIYDVILPLLRSAIWGEETFPFTIDENIDWKEVNKELRVQTIQYLPIDILSRVDKDNCVQYYKDTARALHSWHTIMQEQQALYQLLQNENIPFVILKGAAADYYYPKPLYRCMGDIDFIVKPEDFDRTAKCLEANGYQLIGQENPRHIEYEKNGVLFELHHYFGILRDHDASALLNDRIYKGISERSENKIDNLSFPMLPPLENGLVLLTHIDQHMEDGLGFRQILDWMFFIDREMTDDFWNESFAPAVEQIGLKTLALTVTNMCKLHLGLTKELSFCQTADPSLCDDLLQYIIDQGNFGRKRGRLHNSTTNMLTISDIPSFFITLQKRGLENWKITKKYSFLKPFAWIYQICRCIRLGLMRERPFKKLKEDYLKSKDQKIFLEQLGVTRRFGR